MNFKRIPAELLIVIGGAILLIPFLGITHLFDWDEVNFAEASREMLVTHNYSIPQIDFQPFWEKPPLFFWFQTLAMKIFGVNEFASRLPNAIVGIITFVVLYRLGRRLLNASFGWIWVLVYAGSLLPQLYFKSGIIDPWFNFFIFLSTYELTLYTDERAPNKTRYIVLAGLFAGLAVMTKGPAALAILGLCYGVYAISTRFKNFMKPKHILLFILLSLVVGGIWFLALALYGQQHIIIDFFKYQVRLFSTEDAGHGGPFFYHFIILLIGCFPAAALAILSMRSTRRYAGLPAHFHNWMLILFWVVLILFSIVKTKIVHYSSMCYYPLTFLAAISFYQVYHHKWKLPGWTKWLEFITGFLLSVLIIAASTIELWKPWLLKHVTIEDEFARANLQANVYWTGWEKLPGILLLTGTLIFVIYARKNIKAALLALFAFAVIAINLTIVLITPRVEPYSQGAMIEFMQSKQNERCIVETMRFKSFANYFYAMRQPDLGKDIESKVINTNYMPDVSVYFVGKIQDAQANESERPNMTRLYAKNGFVFYKLKR